MQSHKTRSKGGFCVSVPFGFDFSQNLYYLCIACVGEPGKPPPAICCAGRPERGVESSNLSVCTKTPRKGACIGRGASPDCFHSFALLQKNPLLCPYESINIPRICPNERQRQSPQLESWSRCTDQYLEGGDNEKNRAC